MLKLSPKLTLLVMLILMLSSKPLSAEINFRPKPPVCINRDQEEKFVECFEENLACHEALRRSIVTSPTSWSMIALSVAGGLIAGMILDSQIHH